MSLNFKLLIKRVENLEKHCLFCFPNTYVKISTNVRPKKKHSTCYTYRSCNPEWEQIFKICFGCLTNFKSSDTVLSEKEILIELKSNKDFLKLKLIDKQKPKNHSFFDKLLFFKKSKESILAEVRLSYEEVRNLINKGPFSIELSKPTGEKMSAKLYCELINKNSHTTKNLDNQTFKILNENISLERSINDLPKTQQNENQILNAFKELDEFESVLDDPKNSIPKKDILETITEINSIENENSIKDLNISNLDNEPDQVVNSLNVNHENFLSSSEPILPFLLTTLKNTSTPINMSQISVLFQSEVLDTENKKSTTMNSSEKTSGFYSLNETKNIDRQSSYDQSKLDNNKNNLKKSISHKQLNKLKNSKKINKIFTKSMSVLNLESNLNKNELSKSTQNVYEDFNQNDLYALSVKFKKFQSEISEILNKDYPINLIETDISRINLIDDSYCFFNNLNQSYSHACYMINFKEELGTFRQIGGTEWLSLFSNEIFKPSYGLFEINSQNNQIEINKHSIHILPDYENLYCLIGKLLGLALFNNYHVDVTLGDIIFKNILQETIKLEDLRFVDYTMYSSLKWVLENDISKLELLHTFSTSYLFMGEVYTIDLIENGKNVIVDESNKINFVNQLVDWRLNKSIRAQMDAILKGFFQIITKDYIKMFNSNELKVLICGLDTIETENLKENTHYLNCDKKTSQIKWFWQAFETFDSERKLKLLRLATGSTRLKAKKIYEFNSKMNIYPFTLSVLSNLINTNSLPLFNTCLNRISLPCYESYDKLLTKLVLAVDETREFTYN